MGERDLLSLYPMGNDYSHIPSLELRYKYDGEERHEELSLDVATASTWAVSPSLRMNWDFMSHRESVVRETKINEENFCNEINSEKKAKETFPGVLSNDAPGKGISPAVVSAFTKGLSGNDRVNKQLR